MTLADECFDRVHAIVEAHKNGDKDAILAGGRQLVEKLDEYANPKPRKPEPYNPSTEEVDAFLREHNNMRRTKKNRAFAEWFLRAANGPPDFVVHAGCEVDAILRAAHYVLEHPDDERELL